MRAAVVITGLDTVTGVKFEELARDCLRLTSERTREQLIQMARQWMQLVMEKRTNRQSPRALLPQVRGRHPKAAAPGSGVGCAGPGPSQTV